MEITRERKKCKKCGKGELDTRIPKGLLVKVFLAWLPIMRYRCNVCWKKSYVYRSPWKLSKPDAGT